MFIHKITCKRLRFNFNAVLQTQVKTEEQDICSDLILLKKSSNLKLVNFLKTHLQNSIICS